MELCLGCRSFVKMAMERVSGTIWERLIGGAVLWICGLCGIYILIKGGSLLAVIGLTVVMASVQILADLYRYGKFRLAYVYCGDHLLINGAAVHAQEVVWIREIWLGGGKNKWEFIEIVFLREGQEVRALCMAKPEGFFKDENPSISILVNRIPELRDKVKVPYFTSRNKRVHKSPRPELEHEMEPVPGTIDPMARYRDPYFRRKR